MSTNARLAVARQTVCHLQGEIAGILAVATDGTMPPSERLRLIEMVCRDAKTISDARLPVIEGTKDQE